MYSNIIETIRSQRSLGYEVTDEQLDRLLWLAERGCLLAHVLGESNARMETLAEDLGISTEKYLCSGEDMSQAYGVFKDLVDCIESEVSLGLRAVEALVEGPSAGYDNVDCVGDGLVHHAREIDGWLPPHPLTAR